MKIEPKFYKNWEDDNHCLQASAMMVLAILNQETSWDEVNKLTQYEDGLYSWSCIAVTALSEKIKGIRLISGLDYKQFANRGEEYLKEYLAPNWFQLQKNHASPEFIKEQKGAKELVLKGLFKHQPKITEEEIEKLLENNLLITVVDSGKLTGENRSAGHFVVLYNQNSENFFLHDPGLPPRKGWTVSKNRFMDSFRNELIVIPMNT